MCEEWTWDEKDAECTNNSKHIVMPIASIPPSCTRSISHINILISLTLVKKRSFCAFVLDWADAEKYISSLKVGLGF